MVDQPTAASHIPGPEAVELARRIGPLAMGAVATPACARQPAAMHMTKPLRSNAYGSGAAAAVKPRPQAGADTWEEF